MLTSLALFALAVPAGGIAVLTKHRAPPSRAAPAPVRTLQVVESATRVTDVAGGQWAPDRFSRGGKIVESNVPILYTSTPSLYRSERVGIRTVDVPLRTNGSYLVVLYFAETRGARPGQRRFAVLAQGREVARVDIAGDTGARAADHRAFTVDVPRHRLLLRFRAIRGQPVLSALALRPVSPTIRLPATRLAWHDEFNGPTGSLPDPANWTYDLGPGWNQLADYTDRAENASMDGKGDLVIAARDDPYRDPQGGTYRYTSVRMTTKQRFGMLYGRAEARIRVSNQPGVASSFWGLGTDIDRVDWPRSGELDPVEVRGIDRSLLIQAVHMPCRHGPECAVVWLRRMRYSLAGGFHTFAVERAPGVVIYSLDGRQKGSVTAADVPRQSWVFNKPFYLLLNLIVGGDWATTPPATDRWPTTMLVDWVRAFT
ncbi:MAG: malectin domain-containing carbohydrate-binding protein [Solirubrobacteraceae bacterium]